MSDLEDDLMEIVRDLGDDAPTVLRALVDVYRLGVRSGDKAGYERGYTEGARETKRRLLSELGSVTIDAPGYDEAGTVALSTPIKELQGLDGRVAAVLGGKFYAVNEGLPAGDPNRVTRGTLADILNTPASDLYDTPGFGRGAGQRLYEYLKSIGHDRQDLLERRP